MDPSPYRTLAADDEDVSLGQDVVRQGLAHGIQGRHPATVLRMPSVEYGDSWGNLPPPRSLDIRLLRRMEALQQRSRDVRPVILRESKR